MKQRDSSISTPEQADIVIVGAGAAGLMAGIFAARTFPDQRVLLLDGARTLGAKILVAGGGRCNVTHDEVDAAMYAGSSRNAIRKVLRRFDVPQTTAFFRELGVRLKREETGKLFPVTDDAHTVLDALLTAADQSGALIRHPRRVEEIKCTEAGFQVSGDWGKIAARRVILATGGKALPKSGSDGQGYLMAKALGHTLTARIFPALVPLTLPREYFLCALSGISAPASLELRAGTGKKLLTMTNAVLCTHFGLSGPGPLDFSRYYLDAHADDPTTSAVINWLPDETTDTFEAQLQAAGKTTPLRLLSARLPERLVRALIHVAGLETDLPANQLRREQRRALAAAVIALPLPITGHRGFTFAEVTAGGIPLDDIRLETMESRLCPGLFLCGEICDVDGRIGGYNFQWAWASGYVAGVSAGREK